MKETSRRKWLSEYLQMVNHPTEGEKREAIEWVQTRPACIQEIIIRFPPGCVVELANETKRPFQYGIVSAYCDDGNHVRVRSDPYASREHWIISCCDHLTVIGYWNGFTPEWIKEVLEGESFDGKK